jgi:hypothetical protein
MKKTSSFCLIMFCMIMISCHKDSTIEPDSREFSLKRKLIFKNLEDKAPQSIYEYHYDSKNNLVRVEYNSNGFDSLVYNNQDQLICKYQFEKNWEEKYILYDSTNYWYKDGLLIQQTSYDPWYSDTKFSYKFEYQNSKLSSKYEYYYHSFISYTKYEYSGGNCFRETCFSDSLGLNITKYVMNSYKNGKLLKSETFGFNDCKIQIINYSYDTFGNLITEEAIQPANNATKTYLYVYRYEYEKNL